MDYNKKIYQQTMEKMTLSDSEKEKAKRLFHETDQKRKTKAITKFVKPAVAVAAACAILLAGNTLLPDIPQITNSASEADDNENSCTLTVYAQELTKDGKVSLKNLGPSSIGCHGSWHDYTNKILTYNCEFPVKCKGKNIKTITYSVNGPAYFLHRYPQGHSILADQKEADLPSDFKKKLEEEKPYHDFSDLYENGKRLEYETQVYQSFSVDYKRQRGDSNEIQVYYTSDLVDQKTQKNFLKKYGNLFKHHVFTAEEEQQIMDFLFKDVVITATITFEDNSMEEKFISLKTELFQDESMYYPDLITYFCLK